MKELTEADIRQFLLEKYREPIEALGISSADLPDNFDLLLGE